MKAVGIEDLSPSSSKAKDRMIDVIREAVFDDAVYIFADIPDRCSVWDCDLDIEARKNALYFNVDGTNIDSSRKKDEDIKGLLLADMDLVALAKNKNVRVPFFYKGITFSEKDGEVEITEPEGMGGLGAIDGSRVFFLYPERKNSDVCFAIDSVDATINYQDVYISISAEKVKRPNFMRPILPSLFEISEDLQRALSQYPRSVRGLPPRLKVMWNVYLDIWKVSLSERGRIDKPEVRRKKEEAVEALLAGFEGENLVGKPLARSTVKELAEMLVPDYLEGEDSKYPRTVSHGVPGQLWVFTCLVELLTGSKNVKDAFGDFQLDRIPKLLEAINQSDNRGDLDIVDLSIIDDLYHAHPEINYLRFVEYSKKRIKTAKKLLVS